MLNPYIVILSIFTLSGFLAALWGWRIIQQAKKTALWPSVEGRIEESRTDTSGGDLLPLIRFSYTVDGQKLIRTLDFPPDLTPSQEFVESYLGKYPLHDQVVVYYNPQSPQQATLEPGLGKGDWLVFAIGLTTFGFGLGFLLFSGT
jgi:hypothetical protein